MAKTATEIEVKKTSTNHTTTRNASLQEKLQRGKWLRVAPPAALLIAGTTAFLLVRRQRAGQQQKKRSR
ncbi:MAG TPA: hypothetical protein VGF67_22185 [Ktedonobacteraceae bacterium]|jgi:hypothetical protein